MDWKSSNKYISHSGPENLRSGIKGHMQDTKNSRHVGRTQMFSTILDIEEWHQPSGCLSNTKLVPKCV